MGIFKWGSNSTSKDTTCPESSSSTLVSKADYSFRQNSSNVNPRCCLKCRGYGHIASDCLNRNLITVVGEAKNNEVAEDPLATIDEA